MRWLRIALGAAIAVGVACSSSASRRTVTDGPDSATAGDGGDTGSGGSGGGTADAGDGAVATGPLAFEPDGVELRSGESVEVVLRFAPEPGFTGTLEVALELEGSADGLSLDASTLEFSRTNTEQTLEIRAGATAAQGKFVVRATAGDDLEVTLDGAVIGRPGELDTTFGDGGYVDYQPEGNCNAQDVIPLPDGRFVLLGQALTSKMLVARFLENGEIDESFGPGGNGRLQVDRDFVRPSGTLLSNGDLLVGFDQGNQIAFTTILENGEIDESFGESGYLLTDVSPGSAVPMGVDAEQRIIAGGYMVIFDGVTNENVWRAVLRRYDAQGLDETFAGDGLFEVGQTFLMGPEGSGRLEALAIQSNGNITAVGGYYMPDAPGYLPGEHGLSVRVQSNGTPDSTFGPDGVRYTKFGSNEFGNYERAIGVVFQKLGQNAGKAVVAGSYRQNSETDYVLSLWRHTTTGELDPSFLDQGKGTHDIPGNLDDTPGKILLDEDDGFLVQVESGSATHFVIARFAADGTLDEAWGEGGLATPVEGRAFGMAISGRHLLVVGTAQGSPNPTQSARIARYWLR